MQLSGQVSGDALTAAAAAKGAIAVREDASGRLRSARVLLLLRVRLQYEKTQARGACVRSGCVRASYPPAARLRERRLGWSCVCTPHARSTHADDELCRPSARTRRTLSVGQQLESAASSRLVKR